DQALNHEISEDIMENQILVQNLILEWNTYFKYLVTVWELFLIDISKTGTESFQNRGMYEQIAEVKQYLSVDLNTSSRKITNIRHLLGLDC
ncbi:hypothetical protein, partial [Sphingobacterium sp. MYb388]|uniref:hypothetical protein n=1 Tax=Sphingobacterium sp. MYb388 TaxID=2745437 RepID=UPI0030A9B292